VIAFLDAAEQLAPAQRVAVFDNDGTLWCEKPTYVQYDFLEDALKVKAAADPSVHDRAEYAAVLDGDWAAIQQLGLERVAMALLELFAGVTPEQFDANVVEFFNRARHRVLQVPLAHLVYQPMLELLDELRRRRFTVFIVSGGGTEFVRAISEALYGVQPEAVVGTLVEYEFLRDDRGAPLLVRTARVLGDANEGAAKVRSIQTQLGRRPILAVGNSAGDKEMLEWALAGDTPSLALLLDHDDEAREYRYASVSATVEEHEAITDVGRRLGWTIISMEHDWERVFPD